MVGRRSFLILPYDSTNEPGGTVWRSQAVGTHSGHSLASGGTAERSAAMRAQLTQHARLKGGHATHRMTCVNALAMAILISTTTFTSAPTHAEEVRIQLITGNAFVGEVIEEAGRVLVMDVDGFPCAIAYDQILPDSAYRTKRRLLAAERGGVRQLVPEEHFELGLFALRNGRPDRARRDFGMAGRDDETFRTRGQDAIKSYKSWKEAFIKSATTAGDSGSLPFESDRTATPADRTGAIVDGYKAVVEDICAQLHISLKLVETEHFLIWTDWSGAEHALLAGWVEGMYSALAKMFSLKDGEVVFAGKCPMFVLRTRKRFVGFASALDNYDARGAVGYARSESNGHVHVVVSRHGGSPAAFDAFAGTLVHEGTHAFLYRYRPGRSLPGWVDEGFANHAAQVVLGDRCANLDAANAAARLVVSENVPIPRSFFDDGTIEARYYPVAHSLVAYLIGRDREAFVRFLNDLKTGQPVEKALFGSFDMTIGQLEKNWRAASGGQDDQNR